MEINCAQFSKISILRKMEAAGIFPAWLAQLLDQDDEECERQRESLDLRLAIADSDSDDKSAYPAGHLAGVRTNPTRALRTRVFALQLWYGADDEQFKARVRVTRTTFLRILEAIAKPGEDVDGSGGLPRGRGRPAAPLWLKLMAVLYRLGQCCTINAGADFAGISNGSMCQNMQDICGRFRAVLFEKFVRWPTTPEERQRIRRGFADATDCPGDASPFR